MVPVLKSLKSVKKNFGKSNRLYFGRRARAGEERCSLFPVSASFWENGVHEADTNDVRSRGTRRSQRTSVGSPGCHGLPTPGDVGLNCLLTGRSDACGVCVDINLKIAERF